MNDDYYLRKSAANCPCLFYKPGDDTMILVYVDDIFADGLREHRFFTAWL